jgi:hypothetical protein
MSLTARIVRAVIVRLVLLAIHPSSLCAVAALLGIWVRTRVELCLIRSIALRICIRDLGAENDWSSRIGFQ